MVFGAAVGFWATQRVHGSNEVVLTVAFVAAALSGAAMALIHAFLTITLRASQIVSGLALTIFAGGLGLSAYFGNEVHLAELPATHQFGSLDVFGLGDVALLRPDPVRPVPARLPLVARDPPRGSLPRTNAPRTQRARCGRGSGVGRRDGDQRRAVPVRARARRRARSQASPARATASPSPRGGSRATSLVNGAGWIAIALVIFAFWRPELCLVGAYLFGGLSALPFALQAHDVTVTPEVPAGDPVRHDDRRPRARLDSLRAEAARRACRARPTVRARGAVERRVWTSSRHDLSTTRSG